MALSVRENEALYSVCRALVVKLQAGTAIADTGTDIPVIADFPGCHAIANTTAQIAALLNRAERDKQAVEGGYRARILPET